MELIQMKINGLHVGEEDRETQYTFCWQHYAQMDISFSHYPFRW